MFICVRIRGWLCVSQSNARGAIKRVGRLELKVAGHCGACSLIYPIGVCLPERESSESLCHDGEDKFDGGYW